jgi:hypothetical protein
MNPPRSLLRQERLSHCPVAGLFYFSFRTDDANISATPQPRAVSIKIMLPVSAKNLQQISHRKTLL